MADANNTRVAVVQESSYGTTPTSPTTYIMPVTQHSLAPTIGYIESKQIRSSRQSAGPVKVSEAAGGSIGFEWQYTRTGALWQLLKSVLQSDAETAATTEVTGVTGSGITLAATGIGTGLQIGDIVRARNSSDVTLGYGMVTAVAADLIAIDTTMLDGASNLKIRRGTRLLNGSTQTSFSIEVGDTVAALYEVLVGMVPSTISMGLADGQITSGTIAFAGKKSNSRGTSAISGATYTAAPTTYVMDCKNNVQTIYVAGASYSAKSVSWNIDNSLRSRTIIGSSSVQSVASGTFRCTGTIEAYFSNWTEYDKFVAGTNTQLYFVLQDNAGNAFSFIFPAIRYSAGEKPVQGQDTDIVQRLTWQTVPDTTYGFACCVEAFDV